MASSPQHVGGIVPRLAIFVLVAAQVVLVGARVAEAGPIGTDWPMFHHDAQHQGVSPDTAIGASTVTDLGLRWQANIGPSYVSPVVVYNQTLDETLVYVGSDNGTFAAYDAVTGNRVWYYKTFAMIESSPAVDGNVVYFGENDHYLYALNATTGALICRFNAGGVVYSSPLIADPDGTGKLVYFGDSGLNGGDDGGHFWAINAVDPNAAQDCSLKWSYSSFGQPPGSATLTGSWSPPAFGNDVNGRPLIVFGGSSPEGAVYALDAMTGQRAWRFQTETFARDQDVGAGATISPPGVNGFVDGVVYIAGKDAILYALNLRTGAQIWAFRIRDISGGYGSTRSSPALVGRTLYIANGPSIQMFAVDAVTGQEVWRNAIAGSNGVLSSPAVTGAPGDQVLFVGDTVGRIDALSLANGQVLWSYNTTTLIYSSMAISGSMVFATNSGGFLFGFGLGGGGTSAPPDTAISSPAKNATVTNSGTVTITGTASDDVGVQNVLVSVQDKNRNLYWNAASGTWVNVVTQNVAALGSPGSASTGWTTSFPVATAGGPFIVQAESVDGEGQHDPTFAQTNFNVSSLTNPPDTAIAQPKLNQLFTFPGGLRQSFTISVSGTAVDTAGAHPGVQLVRIVVENLEHVEYYCGVPGCAGGGTGVWKPTYTSLTAVVASPGSTSTSWSFSFPTYDHPHTYKISAWAIDLDGNADPTRAIVSRICVKDAGQTGCP